MSLPKLIERTLYHPLLTYLRSLGFQAIGEARAGPADFSDLVVRYKDEIFVIEPKIGKPTTTLGLKSMAQAARYAKEYKTSNAIVLIYPENYRNQPITSDEMLTRLALEIRITSIIFSDHWTESLEIKPTDFFQKLKNLIDYDTRTIDLNSIVAQIKILVSDLNNITYQIKTEELVSEIVEKLDLFISIGEIKDKDKAKGQIINLAPYLLFNQLLFYHIYQKLAKNSKLPELDEFKSIKDIQNYFDRITQIDYKSIYKTNILGHIPDKKEVIDVLNELVTSIKLLRAEFVTHDLAGRFFHELLPSEVRKILAAFYTHTNSADLLTGLTIDSWDETLIDPACGSGTLLVSSYHNKLRKYLEIYGYENIKKIHKRFLEKDITGIDLMPFAAHITTTNLALQDIEQNTDLVKIATADSLDLSSQLISKNYTKGEGIKISGFEKSVQRTLIGSTIIKKKHGSVSMQGKGSDFFLKPNDIVIMNPPFSDREKMPKEMRNKINANKTLNQICGSKVNLWGMFLVLAHYLLKEGGKIGAVIPINIARGEATSKIRHFLLKNYTTRFIIKSLGDEAFSEGASFKDILYIAQKKKPDKNDYTGIVSIKSSIKNISPEKLQNTINQLKDCYEAKKNLENEQFEIKFIKTLELLNYVDNLMPLIGFTSNKNKEILEGFLSLIRSKAIKKLNKINPEIISEGFHASPSGLSELVFITRPIDDSRTERAFMILNKEKSNSIQVEIKNSDILLEIPNSKVRPALRTLTGIKGFNVEKIDYILVEEPQDFSKILQRSKWKDKFNWFEHNKNIEKKTSFVVVGRRFRPNSKNTHHFAFYSKNKLISPHTFKIIKFENSTEAAIQTLMLNSSITMANILSSREQTTGGFTDIMESELCSFDILNINELDERQKIRLGILFDALKDVEFPSIYEQYITNNKGRRLLDSMILDILGVEKSQIDKILDKLYIAIAEELKTKG